MIRDPGLEISIEPADRWRAEGPLASRVLELGSRIGHDLAERGLAVEPACLRIRRAPPEHVGLGVGTQLGLGVARLLALRAGWADPSVEDLAGLAGRGLRSGIGLHGFSQGGLIVDGGRNGPAGNPPLLSRLEFPEDWSILVVIPPGKLGLHGAREVGAFADLPPSPDALTDRLCRLVLLGLLPSVIERDLPRFGEALEELQSRVGQGFAPAQGGLYARPELEALAALLRTEGLRGVGQSSWGPTLYGFSAAPPDRRSALLGRVLERSGLPTGAAFWSSASRDGASVQAIP